MGQEDSTTLNPRFITLDTKWQQTNLNHLHLQFTTVNIPLL